MGGDPQKLREEALLLPGLREALNWKPNTPQLENAMTYAWEQALKSFIRAIERSGYAGKVRHVPADLWDEIMDFIEGQVDIRDGSDRPLPNDAMLLSQRIKQEVK